jgi:tetratricopeptide (TPR) repeat protein
MTVIFAGDDIEVRHRDMGGDICVVTFTSVWPVPHVEGFGEEFFADRGISAIHFLSRWNHWWQTAEMAGLAERIRAIATGHGYRRILTYGASMGAYGAALHARDLGAHAALLCAPQFTADPAKPPFETRWAKEAGKIAFIDDDMAARMSDTAFCLLVHDPRSRDRDHAELFARKPNVEMLPVYFGGHMPARVLQQGQLLETLLRQMIDGSYDRGRFRRLLRSRRSLSASYWVELALNAYPRGRKALSKTAIARAAPLDTEAAILGKWMTIASAAWARKDIDEAFDCAEHLRALRPDMAAPWRLVARCLAVRGEHDAAIAAARTAASLKDDDLGIHKTLLDCLVRAKRWAEVLPVAERVDRMLPDNPATLRSMARALVAGGDIRRGLATAIRARDLAPDHHGHARYVRELEARIAGDS